MKTQVVAVRDSAVGAFGRPIFVPTIGAGARSFSDEVNRAGDAQNPNQMNQHPEDFELWHLAEFDEEHGCFQSVVDGDQVLPRLISRAKDVIRTE